MERVQKFIVRIIETHIIGKILKRYRFYIKEKKKNYKSTKSVSMRLWHIALQETD